MDQAVEENRFVTFEANNISLEIVPVGEELDSWAILAGQVEHLLRDVVADVDDFREYRSHESDGRTIGTPKIHDNLRVDLIKEYDLVDHTLAHFHIVGSNRRDIWVQAHKRSPMLVGS
ncbi:hypothetical protein D3C86_1851370 [compost metagenome]